MKNARFTYSIDRPGFLFIFACLHHCDVCSLVFSRLELLVTCSLDPNPITTLSDTTTVGALIGRATTRTVEMGDNNIGGSVSENESSEIADLEGVTEADRAGDDHCVLIFLVVIFLSLH